jgi:hypothetical protein
MEESSELKLRAIGSSDCFDDISCGNAKFLALKIFLQRNALYYEEGNLARTYVALDPATGLVVGYITFALWASLSEDGEKPFCPAAGGCGPRIGELAIAFGWWT